MQCIDCSWRETRTDDAKPAVDHCNRESHQVQVTTTTRITPAAHRKKIEVETMGEIR